ncbi:hypothetical protein LguiB_029133 [Lonicera macranthoides]
MTKDNSHATLAKLTETHSPIMSLRLGAQLVIGSKIHNLGLGFSDKCDESWKNFQTIYRSEIFSAKALDSQKLVDVVEKIFDSWGDIVGERRKKRVNGKDSADALI